MDDDARADRTARAVAAARAVAEEHGIAVEAPAVLHDLFSVVVHLAPAPVVMRIPTVLPPSRRADPARTLAERRDEIAVSVALGDLGFPTTRPSPLLPAVPFELDGFVMTAWEHVAVLPDAELDDSPGYVADLHAALRGIDLPSLPFLVFWDDWLTETLDLLADLPEILAPADLALARREYERIDEVFGSPEAFAAAFPHAGVQPIHGDAPTHNVLLTADGPVVTDLEHTCRGPVEWDLAMTGPEFVSAYDSAAVLRGGRPADRELLALCESARWLQIVCCLGLAPWSPPALVEGIVPLVATWRDYVSAT
ncbi:aminoglycoside phosphotransferase family protein [Actinomycetospora termitidis]|uniref:Aminoglycoside phosphotransferase family protein n=1 Tax=Actinomycetospora termitidis TaxID=3053470 RepID=A0ABT7M7J3_9PSEU|nr:aminoglycoside phosphotransferase family protein [Actinomycetospora sp. Odt1-22]MDL5155777.1 aminoglycoside phosphotransferase family protein [Actinomycetospora sp. Odt1-22]